MLQIETVLLVLIMELFIKGQNDTVDPTGSKPWTILGLAMYIDRQTPSALRCFETLAFEIFARECGLSEYTSRRDATIDGDCLGQLDVALKDPCSCSVGDILISSCLLIIFQVSMVKPFTIPWFTPIQGVFPYGKLFVGGDKPSSWPLH